MRWPTFAPPLAPLAARKPAGADASDVARRPERAWVADETEPPSVFAALDHLATLR